MRDVRDGAEALGFGVAKCLSSWYSSMARASDDVVKSLSCWVVLARRSGCKRHPSKMNGGREAILSAVCCNAMVSPNDEGKYFYL